MAEDVGLKPGAPGCGPNLLIIATDDASAFTHELIESRRRAFRLGGAGMDRGGNALRNFQATDRPVRWWQVSAPTDSETGDLAVRIPGQCKTPCEHSLEFAPNINVFAASSVSTQIVDYITRTVVIIDVDDVGNVESAQLADYIAMVSLAQINPDADTGRYASILNLFENPEGAEGLTDWDKAYLQGLYSAERTRKNLRAGRVEIASSIQRAHQARTTSDE